MNQGDIVIINFPFTSLENSKIRPALIISNKNFNKGLHVIMLAISTQTGNELYREILSEDDLLEGKLLKKSYIRFSNILSVEKKLIIKKVGKVKEEKCLSVFNKLEAFLKVL